MRLRLRRATDRTTALAVVIALTAILLVAASSARALEFSTYKSSDMGWYDSNQLGRSPGFADLFADNQGNRSPGFADLFAEPAAGANSVGEGADNQGGASDGFKGAEPAQGFKSNQRAYPNPRPY